MKYTTINLPETYIKGLHELVRLGLYPNRSSAVRAAVRDLLKNELWNKRQK